MKIISLSPDASITEIVVSPQDVIGAIQSEVGGDFRICDLSAPLLEDPQKQESVKIAEAQEIKGDINKVASVFSHQENSIASNIYGKAVLFQLQKIEHSYIFTGFEAEECEQIKRKLEWERDDGI